MRVAVGDSFELREYSIDDCTRVGQEARPAAPREARVEGGEPQTQEREAPACTQEEPGTQAPIPPEERPAREDRPPRPARSRGGERRERGERPGRQERPVRSEAMESRQRSCCLRRSPIRRICCEKRPVFFSLTGNAFYDAGLRAIRDAFSKTDVSFLHDCGTRFSPFGREKSVLPTVGGRFHPGDEGGPLRDRKKVCSIGKNAVHTGDKSVENDGKMEYNQSIST